MDERTPMLSLPVDSAVLMALMNDLGTPSACTSRRRAFSFESVGDICDYIRQRTAAKARRADSP